MTQYRPKKLQCVKKQVFVIAALNWNIIADETDYNWLFKQNVTQRINIDEYLGKKITCVNMRFELFVDSLLFLFM